MTITIRTQLSDEQRHSLLQSLTPGKIGVIYDDSDTYIVSSSFDSNALIGELDHLQVPYDVVNNDEVVHHFRNDANRVDFKLAGNLDLFPLTFTPGL
jgi:hypothetical protein